MHWRHGTTCPRCCSLFLLRVTFAALRVDARPVFPEFQASSLGSSFSYAPALKQHCVCGVLVSATRVDLLQCPLSFCLQDGRGNPETTHLNIEFRG